MIKTLSSLFLSTLLYATTDFETYVETRKEWVSFNRELSFDSAISLSSKEQQLSLKLEQMKRKLLLSYEKEGVIPFSQNFLNTRKYIKENPLYALIEKMPKGGLLHVHSASIMDSDWLIKELTTLPYCFVYWNEEGPFSKGTLHFFPEDKVPEGFLSVALLRSKLPDFDDLLLSLLQMEKKQKSSSNLWENFEGWFTKTKGLIHYKPAFIKYYIHSIQTLIEDNLQYMEMRALNTPIYHLDGSKENPQAVVETFLEIRKEVQKKYPFFDFKIIHTEFRNSPKEKSLEHLELAYFLRSLYPNFIIGYDLVGEEDTGRTTLDQAQTLLEGKRFEKKYGVDLPYYFHDGESSWAYDTNLYDAILLKSKRIGHGLNLFHFPYLMEKMKQEDICLEVCPISNQVLGYVPDLRMHPAAGYLKAGIPCVIGSDDPGLFGYKGITPDLWEAVLAWNLDVKALKKLFINSIQYSGMSKEEKRAAFKTWEERWNLFVDDSLKEL